VLRVVSLSSDTGLRGATDLSRLPYAAALRQMKASDATRAALVPILTSNKASIFPHQPSK
jgi:hypothetical protein